MTEDKLFPGQIVEGAELILSAASDSDESLPELIPKQNRKQECHESGDMDASESCEMSSTGLCSDDNDCDEPTESSAAYLDPAILGLSSERKFLFIC